MIIEIIVFLLCSLICIPIFLMTLPFLFYRWILKTWVLYYPNHLHFFPNSPNNLSHILSPFTTLWFSDYTPDGNVIIRLNLKHQSEHEEDISIHTFRNIFSKSILAKNNNNKNNNKFIYPEFQQYIIPWMGYIFWKWDMHFNINKHIYSITKKSSRTNNNNTIFSEIEINEYEKQLLNEMYPSDQSPWSIIIFSNVISSTSTTNSQDNYTEPYTVLMIKFHHVLGNGISIFDSLKSSFDNPVITIRDRLLQMNSSTRRHVSWSHVFFKFICAPYQFISTTLNLANSLKENESNLTNTNSKFNSSSITFDSSTSTTTCILPIHQVKEISKKFKVSFSAVLLSIYTGGIYKFISTIGSKDDQANLKQMLVSSPCLIPLPVPLVQNKQEMFTTFLLVYPYLPLNVEDSKERLIICENEIQNVKSSMFGLVANWLCNLHGSLPSLLRKFIPRSSALPFYDFSSFPGPNELVNLGGTQVTSMYYTCNGPFLTSCSMLSYSEYIFLSMGVDKLFGSENKADDLVDHVINELNHLYQIKL